MTASQSPLGEAAAFVDLFVGSGWTSCHVRSASIEIFVTRERGESNPMLEAPAVDAVRDAAVEETVLTAPHLGTLVELAAPGSRIEAGQRYGSIELLGDPIDLVADRAGTIVRHLGQAGALIQYEDALVALH